MAPAIQIAGLALSLLLAGVAVRADLRLPALALALLAIPGNVDNLVPQMTLDPNPLGNRTAPAISVVDALIAWVVLLTVREGRTVGPVGRRLLIAATVLAVVAIATAVAASLRGVEPLAAVRGSIVFLRIIAMLYLAFALRGANGDGRLIAAAVVVGGLALVGNGVYTTMTSAADRFTASTFGRNGFAMALILVTIVAAGFAFALWARRPAPPSSRLWAVVVGAVAATCLFGAAATGTRMSLLVFFVAGVGALIGGGTRDLAFARRAATVAAVVVVVLAASTVWTPGGERAVSVVTKPGTTVDAVIEPDTVAEGSEVRTRNEFWALAVHMTQRAPLTGVGPYQWNIERYRIDPAGPRVVADPHNSYLQIAAEFGIPTALLYLVLLVGCGLVVMRGILRRTTHATWGWIGLAIALAALAFPAGDLTNSHLFNVRSGAFGWLLISVAVTFSIHVRSDAEPSSTVRA